MKFGISKFFGNLSINLKFPENITRTTATITCRLIYIYTLPYVYIYIYIIYGRVSLNYS